MDKIIYTCNAEYIGYIFPKRKWWDLSKKPREVQFEFVENFSGEEVGINVRILENVDGKYESETWKCGIQLASEIGEVLSGSRQPGCLIWIPPAYRREIRQEFIKQSCNKKKYETLLIVDWSGGCFADLLLENAEDVNYLAVLTEKPEEYGYVLNKLEREYGLFGMLFTQYRDFVQYQRQVCNGSNALVFMECITTGGSEGARRTFYRFPKGSLVLEFDEIPVYVKRLNGKRMENDYVTLSIFLDNIIKNRYNSVVNEGLQINEGCGSYLQQNVSRTDDKNKLGEKRKGIRKWKKRRIS